MVSHRPEEWGFEYIIFFDNNKKKDKKIRSTERVFLLKLISYMFLGPLLITWMKFNSDMD